MTQHYAARRPLVPWETQNLPGAIAPELHERSELGHLPIQDLRLVVGVFCVPVHALGALLVGGSVDSLDQRTAGPATASAGIDEQIFQVAVGDACPRRPVEVEMDD